MVAFSPLKNSRSRTLSGRPVAHVEAGVPANINKHRGLSPRGYDFAEAERVKYDAYGKQTVLADNGVVAYKPSDYGQFVGFTGRYHDWETGIQYSRTRYYSAALGRFLNRMPWFSAQGTTLWAWDSTVMSEDDAAGFSEMLAEDGFGAYFQDRYNLYDYALGSPSNELEPFSRLPGARPWRRPTPPPPSTLPPGSGVRTPPRSPVRPFAPDRDAPESYYPPPPLLEPLCFPRGGPLPGGITTQAQELEMLAQAAKQNGNFGIGIATRADSARLGRAWVGPGARTSSDGTSLVSKDGLRTYRAPSQKDSPFSTTGTQSNFETRVQRPDGGYTVTGNGHLNIIP
jgi:RHS repeat-associated protein